MALTGVEDFNTKEKKDPSSLLYAMDHLDQFKKHIKNSNTLICLDYDGTLTPIVEDYTKALLSDEMREQIKKTAAHSPVAIVSGRGLPFIKEKVGLENLYYAGSHGFEIEGPEGFHHEVKEAEEVLPVMDKAEVLLQEKFSTIKGVEVERKKYAIAIHFRKVKEENLPQLNTIVNSLVESEKHLKRTEGKKIIELKPAMDWDKGKAVEVLGAKILSEDKPKLIFYLGDDVTDEDAFKVLTRGHGVLVGESTEDTYADYYLKDVEEVRSFLSRLLP